MQAQNGDDSNELNNEEDLNRKCAPTSKKVPTNYKKGKDGPTYPKTAFMLFSEKKEREIRKGLSDEGRAQKSSDIDSIVLQAWEALPKEEQQKWSTESEKADLNHDTEEEICNKPLKVQANVGSSKYPSPPKRPMSAFLAYSNKRRAGLKRKNPQATNADLSRMLSKAWKELPEDERSKYTDEGCRLREKYKREMADWRKQVAEAKKAEVDEQEAKEQEMKRLSESQQHDTSPQLAVGPNDLLSAGTDANALGHITLPQQDINDAARLSAQLAQLTQQSNLQPPSYSSIGLGLNHGINTFGQPSPYDVLNGSQLVTNAVLQQAHNADLLQAASRENYLQNLAIQLRMAQHGSVLGGRSIIGEMPREVTSVDNRVALLENLARRQNQISSIHLGHQGSANLVNRGGANLNGQDRTLEFLYRQFLDDNAGSNNQSDRNDPSGSRR